MATVNDKDFALVGDFLLLARDHATGNFLLASTRLYPDLETALSGVPKVAGKDVLVVEVVTQLRPTVTYSEVVEAPRKPPSTPAWP